jgi:hypothetical protein
MDDPGRAGWLDKVGVVAAHRELTAHSDETEAIGAPPPPGLVEAYASWCAAWDALGRPPDQRDEFQLSDGQLRLRVRAGEREEAWAPRYVANELAGTRQAAAHHRQQATLRAAEAATADDPAEQARLAQAAADATALAATLDEQIAALEGIDQARGAHRAHTAATRAAADRAKAILAERHASDVTPEPRVTAEQWLAEHQTAQHAEDAHRDITDDVEFTDVVSERDAELSTTDVVVETAVPDVREIAATEPAEDAEDVVRVPPTAETAAKLANARRTLAEIDERTAWEEQRAADDERAAQLAQWHNDDVATDQAAEDADAREPVISDA